MRDKGNRVDHQQRKESGWDAAVAKIDQSHAISPRPEETLNLDTLKWNWTHLSMSGALKVLMCRRLSLTSGAGTSHTHRDVSLQI